MSPSRLARIAVVLAVAAPGCAERPPPLTPAVPSTLAYPFTGFTSAHYADPSAWLCLPGRADACSGNLDTTELRPDGSRAVQHETVAPGADAVDCFYVYPTVDLSLFPASHTNFYDLSPMTRVAMAHAARFRTTCRVFAPLYRQATIGAYLRPPAERDSYLAVAASDVLDAFAHYMAAYNGGRKVVLIGHSQGAEMVVRVLSRFFDHDAAMRDHLLVALAIGGHVEVAHGSTTSGTFASIPVCTKPGETGCVVAYRSYLAGVPLEADADPSSPGHESACVNPATLDAPGAAAPRPFSRAIIPVNGEGRRWLHGVDGVTTPFVALRDFYAGECVGGVDDPRHLAVSLVARPASDARESPVDLSSRWLRGKLGLHILDMQLPQGDLVDLVARRVTAPH
jgi:hypothetical protein